MTFEDAPNEVELDDVASDGISSVKFAPNSNQFLLASSWDNSVRLYDVTNNTMRLKYTHQAPVLDCCFQDSVHAWSGSINGQVLMYDFNTSCEVSIGRHDNAVRCIEYCPEENIVVSGGWDHMVKIWDPRMNQCVATREQPDKVYTMGVCGHKLVVGTAYRRIIILDLRQMGYTLQKRESNLKYQTRCIRCFPNQQGYVLSSIEGRVAVEYLDPNPDEQKKKYAFKCHRIKESNGIESIYPVNAIAFHEGYNSFATGGSDGYVNIWDGFNKKRLCQLRRFPTSISSLSFSANGTLLAIASSYLYEQEVKEIPSDSIIVRTVTEQETKPK